MKQHIQTGTLLTLIILGILLAGYLLYRVSAFVLLMLIAIVLTTGIDPLVQWIQRATSRWVTIPRAVATLLVMLTGALVVAGITTLIIGTLINEGMKLSHNWPEIKERLLVFTGHLAQRYPFLPKSDELYAHVQSQSQNIAGYLLSTSQAVFGVIGGAFSLFTVIILTFFFTTFKEGITYNLLLFVPPPYQERVRTIGYLAGQKMGGWLRGQLLLALIITVITTPAMLLLQVPYAVLIGITSGVGELIPMVGPYLGFVAAALIVLLTGGIAWWKIVVGVAFFIGLTQLENYFLGPKIMEKQVELSPVTTIIAIVIGGSQLGLVGALLAIPLSAAGRVILLEGIFPAIQGRSREEIEAGRPGRQRPRPTKTAVKREKAPAPKPATRSGKASRRTTGASR